MKTTEFAHQLWKKIVRPGDLVVDATVGNGYDTHFLATLVGKTGKVIGYEIQKEALEIACVHLKDLMGIVELRHLSHEELKDEARLVVYNLGYLPKGNKTLCTQRETTLKSLHQALLLSSALSVMCYSGHAEGEKEERAVIELFHSLPSNEWEVIHYKWLNREKAPSLLIAQKMVIE